jgi:hypothetical protein
MDWAGYNIVSAIAQHGLNGIEKVDDPVEPFIGTLPAAIPDWPAKHDEYIGQSLANDLRREKDGDR